MLVNNNSTSDPFLTWAQKSILESPDKEEAIIKIAQEGKHKHLHESYIKEVIDQCCHAADFPTNDALVALEKFQNKNAINPFESNKNEDSAINWISTARSFLEFLKRRSEYPLILLNDEYFLRRGGCYIKITNSELHSQICQFISTSSSLKNKKISIVTKEIVAALNGLVLIPKELNMPFYCIDMASRGAKKVGSKKVDWISLENGIIKIDKILQEDKIELFAHDPNFITSCQLPYPYIPDADCPKFKKFLHEALGDQDRIDLIQEWFGYNLASHCDYQKFVILIGQGSDGKSVLLKVLSLMLGEENYVSIGLDCLDPKRTFLLASLNGKMANIVNDMNEIDKTSEGMLKQLVTGEPLTVERKHKDPFVMRSTAKISIATNIEPRFYDRTNGLWRRLIFIKFSNPILDESKQDKKLMNDSWWLESNELPGVFNWAMKGLIRLTNRKSFIIPESIKQDVKDFRDISNAAATFLNSRIIENDESNCPSSWLFREYKNYCKENNYKPLSKHNFTKEVRRVFPRATLSEMTKNCSHPLEPYLYSAIPSRQWQGIKFIKFD